MSADIEAIQKAGANARALGLTEFDNPYYVKTVMPAETGEPIEEWSAKAEAWLTGWKIENAMRA